MTYLFYNLLSCFDACPLLLEMKTSGDNVFTIFKYFHIKGQLDVDKGICCSVVGITLDIIFCFTYSLLVGLESKSPLITLIWSLLWGYLNLVTK